MLLLRRFFSRCPKNETNGTYARRSCFSHSSYHSQSSHYPIAFAAEVRRTGLTTEDDYEHEHAHEHEREETLKRELRGSTTELQSSEIDPDGAQCAVDLIGPSVA